MCPPWDRVIAIQGRQLRYWIRHQEDVYKWEFLFLAANVDAFAESGEMGFKRDHIAGYTSSAKGVHAAFCAMSRSTKGYRSRGVIEELGRQISEDESSRVPKMQRHRGHGNASILTKIADGSGPRS